ncbi:hypothetical protein HZA56_21560 [Candidatus Poribacteria bacterium]|nr:hypothetical protein [Candidatus Poribacteria bacterium]
MKTDRKTIIAIVLAVLAMGVVVYQFLPRTSVPKSAAAVTEPAASFSQVAANALAQKAGGQVAEAAEEVSPYESFLSGIKEMDLAFVEETLRNPMTPLIADPKDTVVPTGGEEVVGGEINGLSVGYTIEGIVWNSATPLALVNNQTVTVGESLDDGSLITEIAADTVRFVKDGKKYFLVFREDR